MTEKVIERKLREEVRSRGGIALKFSSHFFTGMPDRFVLMPSGKLHLVELKSKGKKISPRQDVVFPMLEKMGFPVHVIDGNDKLFEFLNSLEP